MSANDYSRRATLASFGAFVLAPAIIARSALAQQRRFGAIHVDVGPLRANAGDPTASWVAEALPPALAQAMAQAGRSGVRITARIDYILLGPSTGNISPTGSSPDQMIGSVVVGGVVRPLRATSYYLPSAPDQTMIEQTNHDRVAQLSRTFAFWAAREP